MLLIEWEWGESAFGSLNKVKHPLIPHLLFSDDVSEDVECCRIRPFHVWWDSSVSSLVLTHLGCYTSSLWMVTCEGEHISVYMCNNKQQWITNGLLSNRTQLGE